MLVIVLNLRKQNTPKNKLTFKKNSGKLAKYQQLLTSGFKLGSSTFFCQNVCFSVPEILKNLAKAKY